MRASRLLLAGIVALLPVWVVAQDLGGIIRSGTHDEALAAIRAGADVNALQPDGSSPLLWAVYRVDTGLVNELLERGAKPNQVNLLGATPLTEAVSVGELDIVQALLKARADPNLGNDDEQTPLMLAARIGSLPIAEALVKAGAKIDTREKYREQTALMWAIGANSGPVTELLIKHKADIEARAGSTDWGNQITSEPRAQYRPTGGLTPLLYATRSGCLDCVKALLKAGADINRPTPEGVTPLLNAIDNSKFDVANYLLDQGANPHLFDWWGRNTVYLAVDMQTRGPGYNSGAGGGRGEFAAGIRPTDGATTRTRNGALQLLQRLLEMGVDPNAQLDMHRPFRGRFTDDLLTTGCTPLLRAAWTLDRESTELLLRHGALPNLPNVMGVTPVMGASGIGYGQGSSSAGILPRGTDLQSDAIAVLGLLIKAGADVNARITDTSSRSAVIARPSAMTSRQGQTALFGTVSRNWPRVAQFLLENGARTDVKDDAGKTLADALKAQAGGRDPQASEEIIKVLAPRLGS